jgi:hypothetical protein
MPFSCELSSSAVLGVAPILKCAMLFGRLVINLGTVMRCVKRTKCGLSISRLYGKVVSSFYLGDRRKEQF